MKVNMILLFGLVCVSSLSGAEELVVITHGAECYPLSKVHGPDGVLEGSRTLDDIVEKLRKAGFEPKVVDGRDYYLSMSKTVPSEQLKGLKIPKPGDVQMISAGEEFGLMVSGEAYCKNLSVQQSR